MVMSFGGIPLLYYGDEIGSLNDMSFLQDPSKAGDSRWIHRNNMDWEKAERRRQHGTSEQKIFSGLQHMIAVRKRTAAFADLNNRELIDSSNPNLFVFIRSNPLVPDDCILVVGNFNFETQNLILSELGNRGHFEYQQFRDLISGAAPVISQGQLAVPPHGLYWLSDRRA